MIWENIVIKIHEVTERQEAVFAGLAFRRGDLARYAQSIAELHATNVATDASYQRRFNALYGVRRDAQWRNSYFTLLEARKSQSAVGFLSVLTAIRDATGRVEASFASKLVATIDPTRAIYDSIVRRNLGLPQRSIGSSSRIDALCRDYDVIQKALEQMVTSGEFQPLRARFDATFPEFAHFTDLKVLDLMIWQMR